MPMIQTDSQHYTDIADAIRDMSGSSEVFYPADMAGGVRSIPQTIAIQPIIYSLEEREVGVWIDGKPLYQKSFIKNNLTLSSYKDLFASGDLESTIRIQTYNLYFSLSSTFYAPVMPANYYDTSSYRTYSHLQSSTNIKYYVIWYGASGLSALVTIQYTKTTDTPGSGTWTPSGVPAHHYSTEEQVIGTWIDGKPIYEKSFEQTLTYTDSRVHSVSIPSEITNFDKLVDIKAIVKCGNTTHNNQSALYSGSLSDNDIIRFTGMSTNNGTTNLGFRFGANYSGANYLNPGILMVTIQYTKSTD